MVHQTARTFKVVVIALSVDDRAPGEKRSRGELILYFLLICFNFRVRVFCCDKLVVGSNGTSNCTHFLKLQLLLRCQWTTVLLVKEAWRCEFVTSY